MSGSQGSDMMDGGGTAQGTAPVLSHITVPASAGELSLPLALLLLSLTFLDLRGLVGHAGVHTAGEDVTERRASEEAEGGQLDPRPELL